MGMTIAVHVTAGGLSIVSGFVALFAAKGSRLHRQSGMVFVFAMLTMALLGAAIAASRSQEGSVIGGLLTAYLVMTALTTVRPSFAGSRKLGIGLMVMALAISVHSVGWGAEALAMPRGTLHGIPAGMFFTIGTVALMSGVSDVRIIRFGALQGVSRLARHLWRMSFALWIAAASFFLGQADELPKALQIPALLAVPPVVVLLAMFYWLWRVRIRRSLHGIVRNGRPQTPSVTRSAGAGLIGVSRG